MGNVPNLGFGSTAGASSDAANTNTGLSSSISGIFDQEISMVMEQMKKKDAQSAQTTFDLLQNKLPIEKEDLDDLAKGFYKNIKENLKTIQPTSNDQSALFALDTNITGLFKLVEDYGHFKSMSWLTLAYSRMTPQLSTHGVVKGKILEMMRRQKFPFEGQKDNADYQDPNKGIAETQKMKTYLRKTLLKMQQNPFVKDILNALPDYPYTSTSEPTPPTESF